MIKKEISEIKRQFTPSNCSITRICGCYVDGEKNKKTEFKEAFLSLPEDDMFKYFEILRKNLSGTLGKNLLNLEFPLDSEMEGGPQEFLLKLRNSRLQDDEILDAFYDRIIETYDYVGNYLILLIHDAYDIPGKTSDGIEMEDASDEVYSYIMCSICPVDLSKPGLSYDELENSFKNRVRDWVVGMPEMGFLFPAFNDRSTDLHATLYYSKNGDDLHDSFIEQMLGCPLPLPAGYQKESFQAIIEETLGDACSYETVKTIHENLSEMLEEHKDAPEPLVLDKYQVKSLLEHSGVEEEQLETFDKTFDETAGERAAIFANNIVNTRVFEVKTPDVIVKVNPERTDLIETREIDGRQCLVIAIDGGVEVNGIMVKGGAQGEEETQ
ncbi:DUF4317 domain-containing protein [Clostridium sp. AN503]|uniref:DUF4317 domain-containing protein n=1 Tax=Clostridium sp. AN503 TaxID=3160598 RepID=UPI00345A7382